MFISTMTTPRELDHIRVCRDMPQMVKPSCQFIYEFMEEKQRNNSVLGSKKKMIQYLYIMRHTIIYVRAARSS